jgi:hypothetical protein
MPEVFLWADSTRRLPPYWVARRAGACPGAVAGERGNPRSVRRRYSLAAATRTRSSALSSISDPGARFPRNSSAGL